MEGHYRVPSLSPKRSSQALRPSPLPLNSCRINTKSSTNEAKSPTPSPVMRSPWWLCGEGWRPKGLPITAQRMHSMAPFLSRYHGERAPPSGDMQGLAEYHSHSPAHGVQHLQYHDTYPEQFQPGYSWPYASPGVKAPHTRHGYHSSHDAQ